MSPSPSFSCSASRPEGCWQSHEELQYLSKLQGLTTPYFNISFTLAWDNSQGLGASQKAIFRSNKGETIEGVAGAAAGGEVWGLTDWVGNHFPGELGINVLCVCRASLKNQKYKKNLWCGNQIKSQIQMSGGRNKVIREKNDWRSIYIFKLKKHQPNKNVRFSCAVNVHRVASALVPGFICDKMSADERK